MPDCPL